MLHVKFWGGLGNQIFQYSFAKYLEHIKHEEVKFFFSKASPIKNLDLKYFIDDISFSSESELKANKYYFVNLWVERLFRKLYIIFPFFNPNVFIERNPGFNEDFPKKCNVFDGYWQSTKYLEPIEEQLRKDLKFGDEFQSLPIFDDITNANSVSLHIRRGDYLLKANQNLFAECGKDYYLKAVNYMIEKLDNPVFFVFSNDMEWVRNNIVKEIGLNAAFVFVDNTKITTNPVSDFFLMSSCKHNIIANSTFSWWAAWLNKNSEKIVVTPQNWYIGELNETTKDLIPKSWMRL